MAEDLHRKMDFKALTLQVKAIETDADLIRLDLTGSRKGDLTVVTATAADTVWAALGTVGTSNYLESTTAQNATKTAVGIFEVILPASYRATRNLSLKVNCHRVVASGTTLTSTIDAEVWKMADDGTAGSDICATTVVTFTDTTATDNAFTITGTSLVPGDRLLIRITGSVTEGGNAGTIKVRLNSVRLTG